MFTTLQDNFMNWVYPWKFILASATYLPGTLISLATTGQFTALFSPSKIHDAWFARFWSTWGPLIREGALPRVAPLLSLASGVVLDIGPGQGEWVRCFDVEKVTKIYGVEPNMAHHAALRRKVKEAGLEDVYEIVGCGVEELGGRVEVGGVDCVVTVLCMCSIPGPEKVVDDLYSYLKEGGRWVIYEHVVTHNGWAVGVYQCELLLVLHLLSPGIMLTLCSAAIDLVWPTFAGGCSITRDTEKTLREVGHWSSVDLIQPDPEPAYQVLPHVIGSLVK